MKYIGILLVLLTSVAISRDYVGYMNKRTAECKGFLDFIAHMRIQVGCFLRPVKELASGFSSPSLEKSGFIDSLVSSENIYEAYMSCEPNLSLSKEEKAVLATFFSSFGEGYLNEGLKLIDSSYSNMEKLFDKLRDEQKKNTRLVSAISVTMALGIIIFVI